MSGNDVYVGGSETNNGSKAVYWKNGVMVPLSQDTSYVYSINVQGNDVYIAGMIVKKYSFLAAYWRNGIINYLKDGEYAYAAFIDGKDVYIAGIDQSYNPSAVYWKNGVPTRLPTPIPFAYTIFVKHHQ